MDHSDIVDSPERHELLVRSLLDPASWPQGGGRRLRIDTHISTVVLSGDLALKLKKPVDLGFLDFSSLARREFFCHEEVRLNRRLAPDLYLGVSAITGTFRSPRIDGEGSAIDWAVRMRRFDPDAVLSRLPDRLDGSLVARLAAIIADFHATAASCPDALPHGSPDAIWAPIAENLAQVKALSGGHGGRLDAVGEWSRRAHARLLPVLQRRRQQGHIRECHGDLHLGNIALIDGLPVVFDGIEFDPGLRWIDTISDAAFLVMDLRERGRTDLALQWLDRYLELGGDHAGLALLRYYEIYRAMVRAKIAAIRLAQSAGDPVRRDAANTELSAYLDFAVTLTRPVPGGVVLMHGLSGSGKSRVSAGLARFLPALRLRSDTERKRLLGIDRFDDAAAHDGYSADVTQRAYATLLERARAVAASGHVAVVDATFLRQAQRRPFVELAGALEVGFAIIDCDAPTALLRERILQRRNDPDNVSDADLAVLERQIRSREALTDSERRFSLRVTPDQPLDPDRLCQLLDRA